VTYFARGQTTSLAASDNLVIDDFDGATGTSSRGATNKAYGLDSYQHGDAGFNHDPSQRAALVEWSSRAAYLQTNASGSGIAVNWSTYRSLEFRIKLECFDSLCDGAINPAGDVDLSIRLVDGNGGLSRPVALTSVARIYRPVGAYASYGLANSVFQTVRIPISAFSATRMTSFRGVRFSFDKTARGRLSLGNIRLVTALAESQGGKLLALTSSPQVLSRKAQLAEENRIVAVRRVALARQRVIPGISPLPAGATRLEVELSSSRRFPITDALPTLFVGGKGYRLSRRVPGEADRIIFSLSEADYAATADGAPTRLQIGGAPVWQFGRFRKP
jgi:hypothetical protein